MIRKSALLLVTLASWLIAPMAGAVVYEFDSPIAGDSVNVRLELANTPEGVDVTVSIPAGQGDLAGLFGNVADESLVSGMWVEDAGGVVTQWQFEPNQVWKVGGGNTVSPIKNWDFGLKLGETGGGGGSLESASFTLTGAGITVEQLVSGDNQGWVFGVRVQSTLGPEGSAKIGLSGNAPRILITSPDDGALLNATPTPVSGLVFGADVSVTVNGVPATVANGTFAADVPVSEGENLLVAVGTNAEGTASDSVTVTLDSVPPVVTISEPADGLLTVEASTPFSGTVTDASPIVSLTLLGEPGTLTGGAFATTAALAVGSNTLRAEATDAAGNTGSAEVTVVRGIPPAISIDQPQDGLLTNQPIVLVSGEVSGSDPVSVQVNGIAATVTAGTFEAQLPLAEGMNAIAATATSPFGTAEDAVAVTLDTIPPAVVIAAPADGTKTTDASSAVQGSVADASPIASFTVAGQPVLLAADGSFETEAPLAVGDNAIVAAATDAAGNTGSAQVDVVRGVAPQIAITEPGDGLLTNQPQQIVRGTVSGTPPIAVQVNGAAAAIAGETFEAASTLAEGANAIEATATSDFGSASASVGVTLDTIPPAVAIESPADGETFDAPDIVVFATIADASPITSVTLNGGPQLAESPLFAPLVLEPGANPITVTATDAAGNSGSDSVTATLETGPPLTIQIDVPPADAVVSSEYVTVAGLVSDPEASVAVNGVPAHVGDMGWTIAAFKLAEGLNTLTATATRGGASASDATQVTYDPPPSIVITYPDEGDVFRQATTDVEGFVDDPTAFVDVDGVSASVASGGRFVAREVPLQHGENVLQARAVDPHGGVGRDQVDVIRDDGLPGRMRVVFLGEFEGTYEIGIDSPAIVIAGDGEEYRLSLDRIGLPSERFTPPVENVGLGSGIYPVIFIVFSEFGEPGSRVELSFEPLGRAADTLIPISEFEAFASESFSAEEIETMLPKDFSPISWGYFELGGGI